MLFPGLTFRQHSAKTRLLGAKPLPFFTYSESAFTICEAAFSEKFPLTHTN